MVAVRGGDPGATVWDLLAGEILFDHFSLWRSSGRNLMKCSMFTAAFRGKSSVDTSSPHGVSSTLTIIPIVPVIVSAQ